MLQLYIRLKLWPMEAQEDVYDPDHGSDVRFPNGIKLPQ